MKSRFPINFSDCDNMENWCVFFLIWCLIRYFLHPPFQQEIINTFVLTFPDALFEKLIPIAVPVPMQALKIAVLNCAPEIIYRHSKMFYLIRFFSAKRTIVKIYVIPIFVAPVPVTLLTFLLLILLITIRIYSFIHLIWLLNIPDGFTSAVWWYGNHFLDSLLCISNHNFCWDICKDCYAPQMRQGLDKYPNRNG